MPKRSFNTIYDKYLHSLIAQGNHEAFVMLKKRYNQLAFRLCRDTLLKYSDTGVSIRELRAVCSDCFTLVLAKFDASLSSLFSFWKNITSHHIMQYLIDNSYRAEASCFKGSFSIDQEFEDHHSYSEMVCENDDDRAHEKMINDIKRMIDAHSLIFQEKEIVLLNLMLDGYSLAELEHTGMVSRTNIYLTFKTAASKLQKLLFKEKNKH